MTWMYLSIFDEVEQSGHVLLTIDAASLYSEFEKVKDERKAKGKRYQLPFLLTVIPGRAWLPGQLFPC